MVLVTLDQNITQSLKKADIIPDIVPQGFTSSTLVSVNYPNGEDVALGNFIKPSDSADAPTVTFIAPDPDAEYTVLMVDHDAPSKEDHTYSPYRHWVVANIPSSADFSQATELSGYIGPGPPPKTGDHRYIFLVYKQPKTDIAFNTLPKEPHCWDYKPFVQENQLELIGVNFFIS
ncbi:phosphatidylethanolamine-binding protein, partial [Helicostylum pulchrum]